MKIIKYFIIPVILLYVAFCTVVYFFPEKFFYKPQQNAGNISHAIHNGFLAKEVAYAHYDKGVQTTNGWLYLNQSPDNNHKIILFLHGNAHNIEHFYHKMIPLAEAGYSVFIPEYRGFGGQGKRIRQSFLTEDAEQSAKYLNSIGFKNEDIIVYGISLGTHMALHTTNSLQKNGKFNALILEVPFTSLLQAASSHTTFAGINILPLDLILRDKYDNMALIDKVETRVLIMTTDSDQIVPSVQAKILYEKAKHPKELVVYQGASHDTLYNLRNYRKILEWLKN